VQTNGLARPLQETLMESGMPSPCQSPSWASKRLGGSTDMFEQTVRSCLRRILPPTSAYSESFVKALADLGSPLSNWATLPSLCCAVVGGDPAVGYRVSVAWWLLLVAARILDDIEDADPFAADQTKMSTAQRLNVATGLQALAPLVVMERAYKRSKCLVGAHLPSR